MNPRSLVFATTSEPHSQPAGTLHWVPPVAPGQPRRRTLSQGRVTELIADLMERRFYGKLTLHLEAGHIVCAKLEQSIKE